MPSAPANTPLYNKDDKVLCFHGEFLYEAKILDYKLSEPNDKRSPYVYLVHYKGWKNTYVSESLLAFYHPF
jgi:mortality factor 4-like protein 1